MIEEIYLLVRTGVTNLWHITYNQVLLEANLYVLIATLFLSICAGAIIVYSKTPKRKDYDNKYVNTATHDICIAVGLFSMMLTMVLMIMGIERWFNPEYFTFHSLLDAVQSIVPD